MEFNGDFMGIPFGNQTWLSGKWSTNCGFNGNLIYKLGIDDCQIQVTWFFKVTPLSINSRPLNPKKGSLNQLKRVTLKNLECQNHIIIIIITFSNMFLTILKIISAIGIFLTSHRFSNGRHIRRRTFPQREKRGDCRASKLGGLSSNNQWPFQELKLEVPTIYKAHFCQAYVREYSHKRWFYMVQYLYFRILKFPLKQGGS